MIPLFSPVVAVPVRDEEERLPFLLAALAAQCWLSGNGAPLPVILVLNNCTDGSHEVATAAAARFPSLAIERIEIDFDAARAHVGTARRLAMESALARCADPARAAILTTDADAVPRADWVANNLRHLAEGVHLVGGLIVGDPAEEERLGPDFNRRARLHQQYSRAADHLASLIAPLPHDPWPRHHDHTGASLAVRADVYRAVGGLPALPFREDVGLVERVRAAGYAIRHPLDVVVGVSARLVGRAPGGMADCLAAWLRAAELGEPLLVDHPARWLQGLSLPAGTNGIESAAGAAKIPVEEAMAMLRALIADAGGDAHAV